MGVEYIFYNESNTFYICSKCKIFNDFLTEEILKEEIDTFDGWDILQYQNEKVFSLNLKDMRELLLYLKKNSFKYPDSKEYIKESYKETRSCLYYIYLKKKLTNKLCIKNHIPEDCEDIIVSFLIDDNIIFDYF